MGRWNRPKSRMVRFACVLCLAVSVGGKVEGPSAENMKDAKDEDSLANVLLSSYGRRSAPEAVNRRSTLVTVGVRLLLLLELQDKEQKLSVATSLTMSWTDRRLKWNSTEHADIRVLSVPTDVIWVPTVGHTNSITGIRNLDDSEAIEWVTVTSSGNVTWEVRGSFTAACAVDAACFPFDVQTCRLKFTALRHTEKYVKLIPRENVNTEEYVPNSEWELVKSGMEAETESVGGTESRSGFVVIMTYSRRHFYYMFSVIAPSTLVSVLILLVFYLPLDAGERMSFSVTIFLTFSLFQIMVTDRLPNSSGSTSILAIYLFLQMVLSALSVVISVLVLNIHHVYSQGSRMPKWLRRVLLGWLAAVVGMRREIKDSTNNNSMRVKIAEDREKSMVLRRHRVSEPVPDAATNPQNRVCELVQTVHRVLTEVKSITRRNHQVEASEKIGEEWRMGARVIDRLMMIFCVLAVLGSTLVSFLIIPNVNKNVC